MKNPFNPYWADHKPERPKGNLDIWKKASEEVYKNHLEEWKQYHEWEKSHNKN